MMTQSHVRSVGELLRGWRQRRRLSQLDLALEAEVSARHLSFVETGRSKPSRELLLHLAGHLDVPLRERNTLLLAAGYAPVYGETPLDAPAMATVRAALDQVLTGHEPHPAVVVDRHWDVVALNAGASILLQGVSEELLAPPVNALRLTLSPAGMAPRIANFAEWSGHLMTRLRRHVLVSGDEEMARLHDELVAFPGVVAEHDQAGVEAPPALAIPLRLRTDAGELAFVSTVTTFGTPLDVTLEELTLEAFLPADAATAAALQASTATSASG